MTLRTIFPTHVKYMIAQDAFKSYGGLPYLSFGSNPIMKWSYVSRKIKPCLMAVRISPGKS
jgi:hypothetical protein